MCFFSMCFSRRSFGQLLFLHRRRSALLLATFLLCGTQTAVKAAEQLPEYLVHVTVLPANGQAAEPLTDVPILYQGDKIQVQLVSGGNQFKLEPHTSGLYIGSTHIYNTATSDRVIVVAAFLPASTGIAPSQDTAFPPATLLADSKTLQFTVPTNGMQPYLLFLHATPGAKKHHGVRTVEDAQFVYDNCTTKVLSSASVLLEGQAPLGGVPLTANQVSAETAEALSFVQSVIAQQKIVLQQHSDWNADQVADNVASQMGLNLTSSASSHGQFLSDAEQIATMFANGSAPTPSTLSSALVKWLAQLPAQYTPWLQAAQDLVPVFTSVYNKLSAPHDYEYQLCTAQITGGQNFQLYSPGFQTNDKKILVWPLTQTSLTQISLATCPTTNTWYYHDAQSVLPISLTAPPTGPILSLTQIESYCCGFYLQPIASTGAPIGSRTYPIDFDSAHGQFRFVNSYAPLMLSGQPLQVALYGQYGTDTQPQPMSAPFAIQQVSPATWTLATPTAPEKYPALVIGSSVIVRIHSDNASPILDPTTDIAFDYSQDLQAQDSSYQEVKPTSASTVSAPHGTTVDVTFDLTNRKPGSGAIKILQTGMLMPDILPLRLYDPLPSVHGQNIKFFNYDTWIDVIGSGFQNEAIPVQLTLGQSGTGQAVFERSWNDPTTNPQANEFRLLLTAASSTFASPTADAAGLAALVQIKLQDGRVISNDSGTTAPLMARVFRRRPCTIVQLVPAVSGGLQFPPGIVPADGTAVLDLTPAAPYTFHPGDTTITLKPTAAAVLPSISPIFNADVATVRLPPGLSGYFRYQIQDKYSLFQNLPATVVSGDDEPTTVPLSLTSVVVPDTLHLSFNTTIGQYTLTGNHLDLITSIRVAGVAVSPLLSVSNNSMAFSGKDKDQIQFQVNGMPADQWLTWTGAYSVSTLSTVHSP